MSEILSIGQRPTTLTGLYGQEKMVKAIRAHMSSRPPRVWLFSGEAGTGKTTVAGILAVSYNCTHMKLWGDPCKACTAAQWSLHEINAAEKSGVEDMEKLIYIADHKPLRGSKRVIIVDECHALSAQAWKALLKPTEPPPEHAVWIFCTSELRKVPVANQRRPVKYTLRTLNFTEAEAFLTKYAAKTQIELKQSLEPLIEAVHTLGIGAPGVLLQALEKYAAGNSAADSVADAGGSTVDTYNLCKALTAGNWSKVAPHLKDATPDSARLIRAFVRSWLKGGLVSTKIHLTPKQQEAAAQGLIDLANAPFEDSVMLYWLHGVLWKIARRYRP